MTARTAALLAMAAAAGCAVPRKAGFDDVEKTLASRTDQRVPSTSSWAIASG